MEPKTAIVIALDPGESTGLIVCSLDEMRLILSMTAPIEDAIETVFRDFLIRDDYISTNIVIERKPKFNNWSNKFTFQYERLVTVCRANCRELNLIFPGMWKPVSKALEWDHPDLKSRHEKDAYCIFRYWYMTENRSDIGVLRAMASEIK
jgi:hypothetical protein